MNLILKSTSSYGYLWTGRSRTTLPQSNILFYVHGSYSYHAGDTIVINYSEILHFRFCINRYMHGKANSLLGDR